MSRSQWPGAGAVGHGREVPAERQLLRADGEPVERPFGCLFAARRPLLVVPRDRGADQAEAHQQLLRLHHGELGGVRKLGKQDIAYLLG